MIRFPMAGLLLVLAAGAMLHSPHLAAAQAPSDTPPPPPQPLPPALPAQPELPPAPVTRPPTIHEFARSVKPVPGAYDVVLCHPYTGVPVRVCFTLPQGCLQVVVRKKLFCYEIDFDYGHFEVELNFSRRGGVRVDVND